MEMIQQSVVCRLWLSLWRALRELWGQSRTCRLVRRAGAALKGSVEDSRICRFVRRESALSAAWPSSRTCRLLGAAVDRPAACFRWIYRRGKAVWDGSVFFRLLMRLGGLAVPLMGLFMLWMLVISHEKWNNLYALAGIAAVTGAFLAGTATDRRRLEMEPIGPYHVFFFGFVCVALVTSSFVGLSVRFFLFHLISFLIVLVFVSAAETLVQVQLAAALATGGLFAASLYGCIQGIEGVEVVASQQDMKVNAGMPGRVYSFFDNPNNFAEVLVMLLPLLLALLLTSKRWWSRAALLLELGAGVVAIGYTYSRSGWLGLALALVVFLILLDWRFLPAVVVLGAMALPILPQSIYRRFLTIGNMEDTSTRYRFEIYKATGNLMRDFWYCGVGLGSDAMTKAFTFYPTMFDNNYPVHTHNNYLQMWAELGIGGGLAYVSLMLWRLKSGLVAYYRGGNREVRIFLAAALGAFAGILLIGVAEYTWFYPRNMFFFWFLFGMIAACIKLLSKEKKAG